MMAIETLIVLLVQKFCCVANVSYSDVFISC